MRCHSKAGFWCRLLTWALTSKAVVAALASVWLCSILPAVALANRDSIAVIIGNKTYKGVNSFDVEFAHNDAAAIRAFVIQRLGYRESNIIFLKDATLGRLRQVFGDETNPKGKLWNWARPGRSNVFVYYSGHGAPDVRTKRAYLIPTDVDPERAASGYALSTLDRNLELLKQHLGASTEIVVMLDACFSGRTAAGPLAGYSGGLIPNIQPPGSGIIRLSASSPNEVANWDRERKLGLFTSVFLEAVSGPADKKPFGNTNGRVEWAEIARFLDDEVRYRSRRKYGRNQTPQLLAHAGPTWQFEARELPGERAARVCREDAERWQRLETAGNSEAIRQALGSFSCPDVKKVIAAWIAKSDAKNKAKADELAALRRAREELEAARKRLEEERDRATMQPAPANPPATPPATTSPPVASLPPAAQVPTYVPTDPTELFNPSAQPSFSCAHYARKPYGHSSRNPQADILCIDPTAAAWDRRMGEVYRSYRSRYGNSRRARRAIIQSQRNWVAQRDSRCRATWADVLDANRRAQIVACIVQLTQARVQQLQ
ncbi:MAG: caspase family protein [Hyphomicrobiaceae bacterium]|nr:caspase family protein [Hyphomicrobiaceae bacterium]